MWSLERCIEKWKPLADFVGVPGSVCIYCTNPTWANKKCCIKLSWNYYRGLVNKLNLSMAILYSEGYIFKNVVGYLTCTIVLNPRRIL